MLISVDVPTPSPKSHEYDSIAPKELLPVKATSKGASPSSTSDSAIANNAPESTTFIVIEAVFDNPSASSTVKDTVYSPALT